MATAVFTYNAYELVDDNRTVLFDYSLLHDGVAYKLTEKLTFPVPLQGPAVMNGLRALHIALGISYYKTFLQPLLQLPYEMSSAEAGFWNSVWEHGLGEFMYVNKLSADRLARFSAQDGVPLQSTASNTPLSQSAVLGIGGGKDSALAGELLKQLGVKTQGFVMATGEQLGQARAVADTMGVNLLVVERRLDPQLLELQEKPGAYKGHVPISLIFGLVGCVLAASSGSSMVVVANESSASTPRITWQDKAVNHQWSKSFEFEQLLQTYIKQYIAVDMTYFSAIRPLSSVAVAKLFSNYSQYFEVFTSDNYVFRIDASKRPNGRWSLESPKSLSSFILLAPWLDETAMLRIFGINFLDQTSLEALFLSLIGLAGQPPLDCVGTVDELALSLRAALEQGKYTGSALLAVARQQNFFSQPFDAARFQQLLQLDTNQLAPPALAGRLTDWLAAKVAA